MSDCSVIQHEQTSIPVLTTLEKRQQSLLRTAPRNTKYFMWEIQQAVCTAANLSLNELISDRREFRLIIPRQVAIVLCLLLTTQSTKEIGRKFGGRDHATILFARDKMPELMNMLRPIQDSEPLDHLAKVALSYAKKNYPIISPRTPRRNGKFSPKSTS